MGRVLHALELAAALRREPCRAPPAGRLVSAVHPVPDNPTDVAEHQTTRDGAAAGLPEAPQGALRPPGPALLPHSGLVRQLCRGSQPLQMLSSVYGAQQTRAGSSAGGLASAVFAGRAPAAPTALTELL